MVWLGSHSIRIHQRSKESRIFPGRAQTDKRDDNRTVENADVERMASVRRVSRAFVARLLGRLRLEGHLNPGFGAGLANIERSCLKLIN